ncbi:MAG TPA: glycine oxidase ThiO [Polyangiaceae bacterium]|nr:glycine oxidase ThiO [Polyangiaceae bacterium]
MTAKRREKASDVVVVGGGVIGCASAWELAKRGRSVLVLERSVPGAEASSAAAGMLGAQFEAHAPGPLADLARASFRLYPAWVRALERATAIDTGYRECGVLKVAFERAELRRIEREVAWQKPRPRALGARALLEREPALNPKLAGGVAFDGDARVDPRALFRALRIAAAHAGVVFRSGAYVKRVVTEAGAAAGVALDDGNVVRAKHVLVAAGSWTSLVEGLGIAPGTVVPARGQIVELELPEPPLRSVVIGPRGYVVPRDDGRVLVGSTMEFVGYRREVTAAAVRDLLDAAIGVVPALAQASLRESWSSFRPYTADELPLIGKTQIPGLFLASGHHRNGILLAPVTAAIVLALVTGGRAPVPLAPFAPARAGGS